MDSRSTSFCEPQTHGDAGYLCFLLECGEYFTARLGRLVLPSTDSS